MNNEEIEKQLEECENKKQEYFSGWQREKADFINYKNKEGERMSHLIEIIKEDLLLKIIPVLDSFILAEKSIKEKDKNTEGLLLIKKQLQDILKAEGIEEIECDKFDPCFHEAIEELEGEKECIEEIEKGYKYNDKVIRPAKVKVYKKED
ncbi:MAG: nucleotide exchange factor GrpE [Candidatus Microsyncoccus archaeolyticus]|nr:MAG: nucleotide exchange factor GrpE [Candidatus Parcubacteria bacterium]